MKTIIDDLIEDHHRFRRFLGWYEAEIEKLRIGAEPDLALIEHLAEFFSTFPDELHHKKEDIIYDFLVERLDSYSESPSMGNERLHDLHVEHGQIEQAAQVFRDGISNILHGQEVPRLELANFATTFIINLRKHMKQEEDAFFPRAAKTLSDEDWLRINDRLSDLLAEEINIEKARRAMELERELLECYGQ